MVVRIFFQVIQTQYPRIDIIRLGMVVTGLHCSIQAVVLNLSFPCLQRHEVRLCSFDVCNPFNARPRYRFERLILLCSCGVDISTFCLLSI